MPAERPVSKASENRRATKPIMEKRRRARINQCLSELKALILDALNKDPSRHSKLEKADILEMTVRHLQNIQRQQMAAAISTDPSVLNKFKAGFNECASEVSRYINRIDGVDAGLRQRLLSHLSNCLTAMNAATPFQSSASTVGFPGGFPGMLSPLQSLSVQIPGGVAVPTVGLIPSSRNSSGDINNNNPPPGKVFAGLPVIPSRLPNGDFAFLLPSQALTGGNQSSGQQLFSIPSVSGSSLPSSSGPERMSQSSWPPSSPMSPSSRRSASPTTSDNSALSPTGSDGGSDVFIESYPQKEVVMSSSDHHHHHHPHSLDNRRRPASEGESVWRPW